MSGGRKRKLKKGQSSELGRLRGEIAKHGNIIQGLAAFKRTGDTDRFRRVLPEALRHPVYRQLVWKHERPQSAREIWYSGLPAISSFEAELEWAVQALIVKSSIVEKMIHRKTECENLLLLSNAHVLLEQLDEIEREFGLSLWLIEAKINAIQMVSGFSAQREYAGNMLRSHDLPVLTRYVISWFSFRSEENLSAQEFERLLDESIENSGHFYHLIRVALGIERNLSPDDAATAIAYTDGLPPIDRYLFLVAIVQAVASAGEVQPLAAMRRSIGLLRTHISDAPLRRLTAALGLEVAPSSYPLLPTVHAYAAGDYALAKKEADRLVLEQASIDALVLAVRLAALGGQRDALLNLPDHSLLKKIASDLMAVTLSEVGASDADARLAKLRASNPNSSWASSIDLFLQRQRRDERINHPAPAQTFAALRSTDENPFLAYSLPTGMAAPYLERGFVGAPPSLALTEAKMLIEGGDAVTKDMPVERAMRIKAVAALRKGQNQNAIELLETAANPSRSLLSALEARVILAEALLRQKDYERACEVCVDLILGSSYVARRLPLKRLVDALSNWDQASERSERVLGRLAIVILLFLYAQYSSIAAEELATDAFLDYLDREGVEKPSSISYGSASNVDRMLYFFRFVCVPDTLDQCFALRSTRDVEDERARIIVRCGDLYAESQRSSPTELQDELQQIRTRQVIRETSLKLDQSKIFVDVDGIQAQLGAAMRENWNRYRLIGYQNEGESGLSDLVKDLQDTLGRKISVVSMSLPITERNKLFDRMFREVRDQFASSKLFGLNANLSTNIRHGYILRELRRPFVSSSLVTNLISSEAGYRINKYWADRLSEDDDGDVAAFQAALNAFSSAIDGEIERLIRTKIKIYSDVNPEGLFGFSISDIELQLFQQRVDNFESYEDYLKSAFELLWALTQTGLNRVKQCLHDETLLCFHNAMDTLQGEARRLLSDDGASTIEQAISLVRPEVAAAVEKVSSWFTLSTSHEYQDYPLQIAFDVGVATVTSYFSDLDIEANIEGAQSIIMAGWTLPSFARLFLLLMENAALHSGLAEGRLSISGTASCDDASLHISLTNELADTIDHENLREVIARLNADFGGEAAQNSVGTERGSGYPKLWKILRHDLRREYEIDVKLSDELAYRVDIIMNKGGVTLCES